ncbi:hypothetical protein EDB19DRAFT_1837994 [Suillus lakei]|nr:hypothetical protein EDB19DRAFT_1837994 [Suillus lakei]
MAAVRACLTSNACLLPVTRRVIHIRMNGVICCINAHHCSNKRDKDSILLITLEHAVSEMLQTFDDSDGENFDTEIDAVSDAEASDGEDSSGNELETLRTILTVPQPEAPMHEALETAQQAYNSLRVEFKALKKDYITLSATVPACSHNHVLKKTSTLDMKITAEGKKYTLFYHFWVIPGVFPTTPQPHNDPCSPMHWASPEVKLNGAMAELYKCVSKDLHKSMEKYTAFDSLFCAAVSAEWSNIVHTIKSCASLIFSMLKLDPMLFSSQTDARKQDDHDLLHLLKKNGNGEYI